MGRNSQESSGKGIETSGKSPIWHLVSVHRLSVPDLGAHGGVGCVLMYYNGHILSLGLTVR